MSETNLLKLNINDKNFSKIRDIRKNVFTDELGILESELFDEYDEICDHFIIFDGKNVVGAVRFVTVKQDIKLEHENYKKTTTFLKVAGIGFGLILIFIFFTTFNTFCIPIT